MRLKRDDYLDNLSPLENNLAKLYRANLLVPLKGFCRVIEEGNLSNAAEKYGITAGLLTKQIKVIEYHLGMKLFNRDKNCRIFPNEAGLKFYDKASKIINQLENLVVEFSKEMDDEESKRLVLSINQAALQKFAGIISLFRQNNCDIKLIMIPTTKEDGLNSLLDQKVDVVISSKEINEQFDKRLEFIKCMDYIPYWLLWKGHPLENKDELTKNDVLESDLVFNKDGISANSLKNFISTYNISSSVEISEYGVENIKDLIKNKFGIWLIFSAFLTEEDKKYFIFKNAENLFPKGQYGFFVNKIKKDAVKRFLTFVEENKEILDLKL